MWIYEYMTLLGNRWYKHQLHIIWEVTLWNFIAISEPILDDWQTWWKRRQNNGGLAMLRQKKKYLEKKLTKNTENGYWDRLY